MRTLLTVVVTCLLVALFAWQAPSQPAQGTGPTYDATNQAIRVNVVAGGGAGGTSSTFGTAFPGTGTAAGARDSLGAMASLSVSNLGNLNVAIAEGGGSGGTSSNYNQAMPTAGTAVGFRSAAGLMASATVDNAGRLNVNVTSASTLIATVTGTVTANAVQSGPWTIAQGASASTASAWPVNIPDDAGIMVRPGDATNKAVRVNVVAGGAAGGTSSNFGTAFPAAGTAAGFIDPLGGMASATVDNTGRQIVTFATPITLNSTQPVLSVRTTSDSTLTATVTQAASSVFNTRTTSDSTLTATVTQTTAANLNTRPDYSSATGSQASARVAVIGGWATSGAAQPFIRCDSFASISTANSGNWRLIASAAGQNVYICGYTFVAAGPVSIKFVEGKSSAGRFDAQCQKDSVDLTGTMFVAASGGVVNSTSMTPILRTSTNNGFCINLSDGKNVGGHITYTQW